jgi:hypothetical protein
VPETDHDLPSLPDVDSLTDNGAADHSSSTVHLADRYPGYDPAPAIAYVGPPP